MSLPPRFLEEIRDHTQLSQIIGATVRLKKHGREYTGLCPFHNEKSPSFTVNDDKGVYYCFGCGATGDAIGFLQEKQGLSFIEAVQYLAEKQGIPLPQDDTPQNKQQETLYTQLYKVLQEAAIWFEEQLKMPGAQIARKYISQRQLKPETVAQFHLGFAPTGNQLYKTFRLKGYTTGLLEKAGLIVVPEDRDPYDRFRNRLIFPIYDIKGRTVAFGGRVLDETKPKYLNSPQTLVFNKSRILYGLNLCKNELRKGAITCKIVEGYMDVIALHQGGIHGALAPLGTAITQEHIKEVWRYCAEPILCFDGDEAGSRAAERAAQQGLDILKPGNSLHFVYLPKNEDPDSLIQSGQKESLEKLLNNPIPLVDKLWDMYVGRQNCSTPEKMAKVKFDALAVLQRIQSEPVRKLYQSHFHNRFFRLQRGHLKPVQPSSQGISFTFNAQKQQFYILFATIINHPYILHEVEELFSILDFRDLQLQRLREDIFFAFHDNPDLDTEALQSQIIKNDHKDLLLKILCEGVYLHASFARRQALKDDVLKGWKEVYTLIARRNELQRELFESQQYVTSDLTSRSWLRHKALIEQRLRETEFESD